MTSIEQGAYFTLINFYTEKQAYDIVKGLSDRGRNSFTDFQNKRNAYKSLSKEQQDYYDALYAQFEEGKPITTNDIIQTVAKVRYDLEMDLYTSKLKVRSEADFYALFAVKENTESSNVNGRLVETIVSYTPVARVKPMPSGS
jgi:hypothetical protein